MPSKPAPFETPFEISDGWRADRIVQEALTNTLKPSSALTAQISLTYREQDLTVEVLDAGPGRGTVALVGQVAGDR